MSETLDHTEPAGAIISVLRTATVWTVSWERSCGTATFGCPASSETSGIDSVICSGAKIRVRTNVSHGIPEMRWTSRPLIA